MDDSDPAIAFDIDGLCSHCRTFDLVTREGWHPDAEGSRIWASMLEQIRASGQRMDYDCILGLSGGVDSSYLAIKCKEWNLRPLVVHVDAGWNSELAVGNIEKIVKYCNFDLHTVVIDWEEMRDLQLAYLKAGVANQDVPQDHVFFSSLYHYATKHGIRFILSGGNIATEGIPVPAAWHGAAMDAINLRSIHSHFGARPLRRYSTISFFQYYLWYPFIKRMRTLRPLNYLPYNKDSAIVELEGKVGWRAYGRKHGESLFTRFFQNYYLPTKFGYDKRLPHLSSLINSGQLTRDKALELLREPLYSQAELDIDMDYFCKKLRISRAEFNALIAAPNRDCSEFPNWNTRLRFAKLIQRSIERLMRARINVYS